MANICGLLRKVELNKHKQIALNSHLETYQILTNDDQMLIFCLSYFITTLEIILLNCEMTTSFDS